jgi:hypothetical protein
MPYYPATLSLLEEAKSSKVLIFSALLLEMGVKL